MKNLLKINSASLLFILLLAFVTTVSFAQKDEKQLSLDFADDLKNAKYHELYGMLDSSIAKNFGETNFKTTCDAIIGKLGVIENYSFTKEETAGGMIKTTTKCNFKSIALDMVLAFNKSKKVVGFHFTAVDESSAYLHPAYDSAKLYTEKQIMVTTGRYMLPGILTVPNHIKNPPVVIFVQVRARMTRTKVLVPINHSGIWQLDLPPEGLLPYGMISVLRYTEA